MAHFRLSEKTEFDNRGCRDPNTGVCKARFPREIHESTGVDAETGALIMRKGEAWMNTFTPTVSYLLRCNHDVTSLMSGTAIKSVIAYVADYITKTPLKTHVMFKSVQQVFDRNTELMGSTDKSRLEKARSIMTKIVNALTAASEIGGPMAAMYLLNHPDHYTDQKFRNCFWKSYVFEVMRAWDDSVKLEEEGKTKVMLEAVEDAKKHKKPQIVAMSPVLDYIHRPDEYESVSLYDWIRLSDKKRMPYKKKAKKNTEEPGEIADGDSDFENNYEVDETAVIAPECNPECESDDEEGAGVRLHQKGGRDVAAEEEEESEDEANTQSQPATNRQVSVETLREEEEESEDELLMTTANNRKLEREIKEHTISMIHKKSFKFAAFRKEHPQVMSHHVRLVPEHEGLIPNFIGGSMPRKDSGSREQYCMTMLTLFRPWRSGKDLRKDENTLWDEEFNA